MSHRRPKVDGFPERLSAEVADSNLSIPLIAALAGIGVADLKRYMRGETEPSLSRLVRLAKVLERSTDHLLGLEQSERGEEQ